MVLRCIHRHTIEDHPACFAKGKINLPEHAVRLKNGKIKFDPWYKDPDYRIGYLDIESDGLTANFGTMLSWAIKEKDGKTKYDVIRKKELFNGSTDKRITKSLIEEMLKYKILVTYYGTGFDIPYARTKAMFHGIEFPSYSDIFHFDLYYTVRSKMKLSRNSLAVVTGFLGIDGKTPLDPNVWRRGKYGDPKALKEIITHNIGDVEILEELHNKLEDFRKWMRKSI